MGLDYRLPCIALSSHAIFTAPLAIPSAASMPGAPQLPLRHPTNPLYLLLFCHQHRPLVVLCPLFFYIIKNQPDLYIYIYIQAEYIYQPNVTKVLRLTFKLYALCRWWHPTLPFRALLSSIKLPSQHHSSLEASKVAVTH